MSRLDNVQFSDDLFAVERGVAYDVVHAINAIGDDADAFVDEGVLKKAVAASERITIAVSTPDTYSVDLSGIYLDDDMVKRLKGRRYALREWIEQARGLRDFFFVYTLKDEDVKAVLLSNLDDERTQDEVVRMFRAVLVKELPDRTEDAVARLKAIIGNPGALDTGSNFALKDGVTIFPVNRHQFGDVVSSDNIANLQAVKINALYMAMYWVDFLNALKDVHAEVICTLEDIEGVFDALRKAFNTKDKVEDLDADNWLGFLTAFVNAVSNLWNKAVGDVEPEWVLNTEYPLTTRVGFIKNEFPKTRSLVNKKASLDARNAMRMLLGGVTDGAARYHNLSVADFLRSFFSTEDRTPLDRAMKFKYPEIVPEELRTSSWLSRICAAVSVLISCNIDGSLSLVDTLKFLTASTHRDSADRIQRHRDRSTTDDVVKYVMRSISNIFPHTAFFTSIDAPGPLAADTNATTNACVTLFNRNHYFVSVLKCDEVTVFDTLPLKGQTLQSRRNIAECLWGKKPAKIWTWTKQDNGMDCGIMSMFLMCFLGNSKKAPCKPKRGNVAFYGAPFVKSRVNVEKELIDAHPTLYKIAGGNLRKKKVGTRATRILIQHRMRNAILFWTLLGKFYPRPRGRRRKRYKRLRVPESRTPEPEPEPEEEDAETHAASTTGDAETEDASTTGDAETEDASTTGDAETEDASTTGDAETEDAEEPGGVETEEIDELEYLGRLVQSSEFSDVIAERGHAFANAKRVLESLGEAMVKTMHSIVSGVARILGAEINVASDEDISWGDRKLPHSPWALNNTPKDPSKTLSSEFDAGAVEKVNRTLHTAMDALYARMIHQTPDDGSSGGSDPRLVS